MPWTGERNGGFTTGKPWLRLGDDVATRNVAAQEADEGSVLTHYRRLIATRREIRALQEQRVRLEDSILAEVKIEVATIAQQQQLDVVLTRHLANVAAIDLTPDVVEKLKR